MTVNISDNAMRGMPLEPSTVASIDSFILAAVLLILILLAFNARHVERIFRSFFHDVWSIRERENVFDNRVATETQTLMLLLLLTSVLEGLLLAEYFFTEAVGQEMLIPFAVCATAALVFNIFSVAACTVTGYTFTTGVLAMQWRRGLFASQAMLGLLLLIPTVIIIVEPSLTECGIIIASTLYILTRLLYILKGIRIFFNNYISLLYFILYLCTLEIIPLLVVWRFLSNSELLN